jgi:hypothetical protein
VLRLCLLELFQYRLMQTDPNWANFLWNDKTQKVRRAVAISGILLIPRSYNLSTLARRESTLSSSWTSGIDC